MNINYQAVKDIFHHDGYFAAIKYLTEHESMESEAAKVYMTDVFGCVDVGVVIDLDASVAEVSPVQSESNITLDKGIEEIMQSPSVKMGNVFYCMRCKQLKTGEEYNQETAMCKSWLKCLFSRGKNNATKSM